MLSKISSLSRSLSSGLKIVCALYPDPKEGYPPKYARDAIPEIPGYSDFRTMRRTLDGNIGQTLPTPKGSDVSSGELLGCVSGALGLRSWLESLGHTFVVTSDKDGPTSELEKELVDADIVISQPFWPAYITPERFAKSPKLKHCITAGIGSDHVDLGAAAEHGATVTEVTFCNSISVAEHVVMMILSQVRNYMPMYKDVCTGGWSIADIVSRSYDVEGMHVGTVAAGRIGLGVLRRLYPFDVHLHYVDRHRLPEEVEKELKLTYHGSGTDAVKSMVPNLDVLTLNCPLTPETEHMIDADMIGRMKRGTYIINTARGKLCVRDDIASALESGHLAGYAGDVWFPQPAPQDHPWRSMKWHGMTPHTSGTSLSAQHRYATGVREILECIFEGREIRDEYIIMKDGKLAGTGAYAYAEGGTTGGSEEATNFKR